MKKIFLTIAAAAVLLLALVACGGSNDGLVGTWEGYVQESGLRMDYSFEFNADGTGRERVFNSIMTLSTNPFTWTSEDGVLSITLGVNTHHYYYEIDGSTLSLTSTSGSMWQDRPGSLERVN